MNFKPFAAALGALSVIAAAGIFAPTGASATVDPSLDPWQRVALGYAHTLAIDPDGQVWAWGANSSGQLGDGSTTSSVEPVEVAGLTDAVAVGAGRYHSIAVTATGEVWAWGDNGSGQVGVATADSTPTREELPVRVDGLADVVSVTAGDSFTLALTEEGKVWAWGANGSRQFGAASPTASPTPLPVPLAFTAQAIAAGTNRAIALSSDGEVWKWGGASGSTGALTRVDGLPAVRAIAHGWYHALAATTEGDLYAFGENSYGELGVPTTTWTSAVPLLVDGLPPVVGVAAGAYHSVAMTELGEIFTWGTNYQGQFGLGTGNSESPTPQSAPSRAPMIAVIAGGDHTFAVNPQGLLYSWGRNGSYQLGDKSTTSSGTPDAPTSLSAAQRPLGFTVLPESMPDPEPTETNPEPTPTDDESTPEPDPTETNDPDPEPSPTDDSNPAPEETPSPSLSPSGSARPTPTPSKPTPPTVTPPVSNPSAAPNPAPGTPETDSPKSGPTDTSPGTGTSTSDNTTPDNTTPETGLSRLTASFVTVVVAAGRTTTVPLTAYHAPGTATGQAQVRWTASSPKVATLAKGKKAGTLSVTAGATHKLSVHAAKTGRSQIVLTSPGAREYVITVKVIPASKVRQVTKVTITSKLSPTAPPTASPFVVTSGKTLQLKARVTPLHASRVDATWTSSNPGVATINAVGRLTATAPGTTVITCTVGGKTAHKTVRVTPTVISA
jgi:alpha-tubulin suppressor-like RCC1 family protein